MAVVIVEAAEAAAVVQAAEVQWEAAAEAEWVPVPDQAEVSEADQDQAEVSEAGQDQVAVSEADQDQVVVSEVGQDQAVVSVGQCRAADLADLHQEDREDQEEAVDALQPLCL